MSNKKISLKSKMLLLNSCMVIFTVILISIIAILAFTAINNRNIENLSNQIMDQVAQNVNYYSTEMHNISATANYDYSIQKFLSVSHLTDNSKYVLKQDIENIFTQICKTRTDINSIFLFSPNNDIICTVDDNYINPNYNFSAQDWYKQIEISEKNFIIVKPHRQSYLENSADLVISLVAKIKSYDSNENVGIIMLDLNLDSIKEIASTVQLGEDGYIIIIDNEGNVIYHPDYSYMYRAWDEMYIKELYKADDSIISDVLSKKDSTFIKSYDERTLMITSKHLPAVNWSVVGVYPQNTVIAERTNITLLIISIGLVIALIGIFATRLIYSLIFDPINKLQIKMKQAEAGVMNVLEDGNYSNDEIGALNKSFDQMIKQISELMMQIKAEERQKRKAELNFLQAQINPHFLYNTLDSIVWMAETNHKDVVKMTESLAKLFRLALSRGKEIITIKDEVEHVENYLIIQKMRYKNKLDFTIDVIPEVLAMQTLKLILQPIVENAIYHGVKNTRKKGNILIKGRIVMGDVLLQVMDDGAGIEKDKIKTLLKKSNQSGVGMKNVDERIKLYYGEKYGLEVLSERGIGTVVDIWIPAIVFEDAVNEK